MTPEPSCHDMSKARAAPAEWPWWLVTATYFAASCLMHLQFSLWLVRPRDLPWGRHALSELVPAAAAVGALVLAVVVIRQLRRRPRPWILGSAWLLWALAVFAIDRFLTYSASEYFHYPQYALLAWLIARTLDPQRRRWIPGRVLFWTTLLSAADELLQYLWITASYSHYFDFNDVLVNFVAGVAGVLIYYGLMAKPIASGAYRRPLALETSISVIATLLVAGGLASGRLQLSPTVSLPPGGLTQDSQGRWTLYLQRSPGQHGSWQSGPHRGLHYVLRPSEALLGLAVAAVLIVGVGRRANLCQQAGRGDAAATISPSSAVKSR